MSYVMAENRCACRNLKRSLGERRCRWESNIQPALTEIGQRAWMDLSGTGELSAAGCFACCYELSDFIKRREFLDLLMNYQALKVCLIHIISDHK